MPKHIAIVGSRSRTDRETVDRLVAGFALDIVIVSGGAAGPDTWAEEAAQKYGLRIHVLSPDLSGVRSQGQATRRYHRRNQLIVDMADEMFALVAPNRRGGTEDAIRRARKKGICVTLLWFHLPQGRKSRSAALGQPWVKPGAMRSGWRECRYR